MFASSSDKSSDQFPTEKRQRTPPSSARLFPQPLHPSAPCSDTLSHPLASIHDSPPPHLVPTSTSSQKSSSMTSTRLLCVHNVSQISSHLSSPCCDSVTWTKTVNYRKATGCDWASSSATCIQQSTRVSRTQFAAQMTRAEFSKSRFWCPCGGNGENGSSRSWTRSHLRIPF